MIVEILEKLEINPVGHFEKKVSDYQKNPPVYYQYEVDGMQHMRDIRVLSWEIRRLRSELDNMMKTVKSLRENQPDKKKKQINPVYGDVKPGQYVGD